MRKLAGLAFSIIALAAGAAAQSNVTTTSGGTANTVPVFTSGTNVENSPISISGSNVGIGTTNPANALDVNGGAAFGTYAGTAAPANALIVGGSIGIGTASPLSYSLLTLNGTQALPSRVLDFSLFNLVNTFAPTGQVALPSSTPRGPILSGVNNAVNLSGLTLSSEAPPRSSVVYSFAGTWDQVTGSPTFNFSSSGDLNYYGVYGQTSVWPTGTIESGSVNDYAGYFSNQSSNANLTNVNYSTYGIGVVNNSQVSSGSGSTYGAYINNAAQSSGTTYGAYVANGGNGSLNYGLFLSGPTNSTDYSIFSSGQAPSYLAGSVGIGTTSPGKQLDVSGTIRTSSNANTGDPGGIVFPDGTTQTTAFTPSALYAAAYQLNTLAIGGNPNLPETFNYAAQFLVDTNQSQSSLPGIAVEGSDRHGMLLVPSLDGAGTYNNIVQAGDVGIIYSNFPLANNGGAFVIAPWATSSTSGLRMESNGNVGIGTTSPNNTLEVNGTAQVDTALVGPSNGAVPVGAGGIVFPNGGGTQTTAWTGVLCGGDYAEDMRTKGDKAKYEPGDVLVLASGDNSDVQKSFEPYSTLVAGIFATKPGVVGRRAEVTGSSANIPMAMVGVVPTKVSAENGPIHKGDLLVTSSKPGFAMKGTDRSRMLGAVIGKAMGSLNSGTGVIEVLVTLQ